MTVVMGFTGDVKIHNYKLNGPTTPDYIFPIVKPCRRTIDINIIVNNNKKIVILLINIISVSLLFKSINSGQNC